MHKKIIVLFVSVVVFLTACTDVDQVSNIEEFDNEDSVLQMYSPEELLSDIEFLINTIEEVHPNPYYSIGKEAFYKELEEAKSKLNKPMNGIQFYKIIAPLISLLNDGHTNIYIPETLINKYINISRMFPLIIEVRDNRIFTVRDMTEEASVPLGAEILTINDVATHDIVESLKKYISAERDPYREVRLERDFYSLLWIEYGFIDEYEITYSYNDDTYRLVLKGIMKNRLDNYFTNKYRNNTPYFYRILDNEICYLNFKSFTDYNSFAVLLEKMFDEMEEKNIKNLIIDIRDNGGGNSSLGNLLFSYIYPYPFYMYSRIETKVSSQIITRQGGFNEDDIGKVITHESTPYSFGENRFNGRVVVLTNRYTFSSASDFAAIIKDYNGGVLIGEETGGLRACYGDVYSFTLPNTKLQGGVSYKYFVGPNGDETPKGIIPHHTVLQTFEDTRNKVDTVLEFAKDCILNVYDNEYDPKVADVRYVLHEASLKDYSNITKIINEMYTGIFNNDITMIEKHIVGFDRIEVKNMVEEYSEKLNEDLGQLKEVNITSLRFLTKGNEVLEYYIVGEIIGKKNSTEFSGVLNTDKKVLHLDSRPID